MAKVTKVSGWSLRSRLLLATLVVVSLGIGVSDFAAHSELKKYLIKQVDQQLINVTNGSVGKLNRAGIDPNANEEEHSGSPFRIVRPLRGVPTETFVTLLDANGNVLGRLGGDIPNTAQKTRFDGFTTAKVAATNGVPFTIKGSNGAPDTRVIAQVLPTGLGSIVVALSLNGVDRTLHEMSLLFFFISLIVLLLIAFLSRFIISLSLRPLSEVEKTAAAIAAGDLSARLPENNPKTEVGKLTRSLNTMLARIEESFAVKVASEAKLRQFVADASHELRTPLTAIRGFAELHRQGAVEGIEKTKELIGRIEKESIRMGSLVEDLLLLARMDEARPVATEPVDLSHLVNECIASAKAAGPEHPITSDIDPDIFILGDSKRIHQAVANLLANARTHTPLGTKITVAVKSGKDDIRVSVSDEGPGLSSTDQEKIFERFFRADPSRQRSSGEGSGLGLSIVDAIMKLHGGSVSVESQLGQGATFTLTFPIKA
jgi:two-component system, OmpR family, sensor kinase